MAYQIGDLEFGNVTDSRTDNYGDGEWAHLRHSCMDWVIGGPAEVRQMILDLQALLKTMEGGGNGVD